MTKLELGAELQLGYQPAIQSNPDGTEVDIKMNESTGSVLAS